MQQRQGIAVFALTAGGAALAAKVAATTGGAVWLPEGLATEDQTQDSRVGLPQGGWRTFSRVGPALRSAFAEADALVCVMATGVVVRSLASVLEGKLHDPAVLCVDERGRFVIPLLAGHVGGANALARVVARALGAQAVITTSSDVQGLLGPDLLADALDAAVADADQLLSVSATLANRREVELRYDPGEMGAVVDFLVGLAGYRLRSYTTVSWMAADPPLEEVGVPVVITALALPQSKPGQPRLQLVPRWTVVGVGCTRGTEAARLVAAVRAAMEAAGLHPAALRGLASVEAKRDEPGLAAAADELGIPLTFVADGDIEQTMATHCLDENDFVRANVGIGGVAEPAALFVAGSGARLVLPKQAGAGITVALAQADGGTMLRDEEERWVL